MSFIKSLFAGGAAKLTDSIANGLDKLITNKEELAKVNLLIKQEVNRNMEAMKAHALREVELEIQDRTSARTAEVERLKSGSKNVTQNVLAYLGILGFFFMTGYIISRGLGHMSSEESFIIGNLTGLAGAIAKDIYGYYFGSSIGSRNKEVVLERDRQINKAV